MVWQFCSGKYVVMTNVSSSKYPLFLRKEIILFIATTNVTSWKNIPPFVFINKKWDIRLMNNIVSIILILLVIGLVVYFYYNYRYLDTNEPTKTKISGNIDDIDSIQNIRNTHDIHNIHNIHNVRNIRNINNVGNKINNTDDNIDVDSLFFPNTVSPTNQDPWNPDEQQTVWDASFGVPLMSSKEKQKFANEMQDEYKKYEKSLGKFTRYRTDKNTIIPNEFDKANLDSKSLHGKTIKNIYDKYTAGPKAKSKTILKSTPNVLIYDDESEMNGGNIKGTKLHAYDNMNECYQSSSFGNQF